jgi:hypothetical protein
MPRTRTHPRYFHSSLGKPELSQRADKSSRFARLYPRGSSRCPASRPTTDGNTGSYVPARRRTSAHSSSSAVHASPRAARGTLRRTTLCWMLPLGDGSGNSFRRCFRGNLRRAPSRKWNGCASSPIFQRLASGVDRSLPGIHPLP